MQGEKGLISRPALRVGQALEITVVGHSVNHLGSVDHHALDAFDLVVIRMTEMLEHTR